MRLFIGIPLNKHNKRKLKEIQKKYLNDYKIVDEDNLHLTLIFLGEVDENKINIIIDVIKNIDVEGINISINKIQSMRSLVIGRVIPNNALITYQKKLANKLKENGFSLEERKYFPHITLARKANFNTELNVEINQDATEVILFESILDSIKANYVIKYKKHID